MKKTILLISIITFAFTATKAQWEQVGSSGFSHDKLKHQDIAINSQGTPYVFYTTTTIGVSNNTARIMKYNGTAWETVGQEDITSDCPDCWCACEPYIEIDDQDNIYIAYRDIQSSDYYNNYVKKYNNDLDEWETIGEFQVSGDLYITNTAFCLDKTGTPYIAYSDLYNTNTRQFVKKYTEDGTWKTLANTPITDEYGAYNLSITADDSNNIWAAYGSQLTNDCLLEVKMYDVGTNSWELIGQDISADNIDFSDKFTSIVIDNNIPRIGVTELIGTNSVARVYSFIDDQWTSVIINDANTGGQIILELNSSGTPYALYNETDGGAVALHVKKLEGETWSYLGEQSIFNESTSAVNLAVKNNASFVVFGEYDTHKKSTVMQYVENVSINNISKNSNFTIYPNPSNGIFTLQTPAGSLRPAGVSITNITGKTIKHFSITCTEHSRSVNNQSTIINLENQPKGIYFINIQTETGIYTEKLIIQ